MLLQIKDLNIKFPIEGGYFQAVKNLSLHIAAGETLGLVGESGSGKSVTGLSIMRLLQTATLGGEILFAPASQASGKGPVSREPELGKTNIMNLLQLPESHMRQIRGTGIAMIFQEPMSSLNPVLRCGPQVTEAIQLHQKIPFSEAREQVLALFERVRLADPMRIFNAYPHELSGGQKQRVMIAMAMSGQPSLLIADEPTTALDVTVQKTILELMQEWRVETQLSMLFISHDLGVISMIADRVAVMQSGEIVETGPVDQILQNPEHPYTRGLIACRPSLRHKLHYLPTIADFHSGKDFQARVVTPEETQQRHADLYVQTPLLAVKNISVRYPARKNWLGQPTAWLHALDNLSFEVFPGEIFGLAGESGCGKTTLGRVVSRLQSPDSGQVWYRNLNLEAMSEPPFRSMRREIQIVFQDPYASLNPRLSIGEALLEPMRIHRLYAHDRQRWEKIIEILETVGLEADHIKRYPVEFSGGQRQRICLARALTLQPKLLICDEIVSALDVSVQATVLNLLVDLQKKFGLTYLFISHDLSVIKQMCDRVMIMNRGKIEEIGFPEQVYTRHATPYIQNLIESIPGGIR